MTIKSYVLEMNACKGWRTKNCFYIDAKQEGNFTRYINHSCNANTEFELWEVEGLPVMCAITLTEITQGEEITIDYIQDFGHIGTCLCDYVHCRGKPKAPKDSGKHHANNPSALLRCGDVLRRLLQEVQSSIREEHALRAAKLGGLVIEHVHEFYESHASWRRICYANNLLKTTSYLESLDKEEDKEERNIETAWRMSVCFTQRVMQQILMRGATVETDRDAVVQDVLCCITINEVKITGKMPCVPMRCVPLIMQCVLQAWHSARLLRHARSSGHSLFGAQGPMGLEICHSKMC